MSCNPLVNTYTVPCRQLSGVNTLYLAQNDINFGVIESRIMTGVVSIAYQDPVQAPYFSDTYTPGTYSYSLQDLSDDSDLFYDTDGINGYTIQPWANAQVVIHIGPTVSTGRQSITATINSISGNYGIDGPLYIQLSDILVSPALPFQTHIAGGNSVFLEVNTQLDNTYQVINNEKSFYHFSQRLEQASYLESGVYGENAMAYNQKLEITLEGYDGTTMKIVDILNRARLRAIIVDQNNNYYLVGNTNYLTTSSGEGGLGKAATDGVKTTLLLEGKELLPALQLNTLGLFAYNDIHNLLIN
jgi:hypothetical protein